MFVTWYYIYSFNPKVEAEIVLDNYYYPAPRDDWNDVWVFLVAASESVSMSYFPWRYALTMKGGLTRLSRFDVLDPALKHYEPDVYKTHVPQSWWDIIYHFKWTDPQNVIRRSFAKWSYYDFSNGQYINLLPKIIGNTVPPISSTEWIDIKEETELYISLFWWDDDGRLWYSPYIWKSMYSWYTKHTKFRGNKWEIASIWIRETEESIWPPDDSEDREISADKLKDINFATLYANKKVWIGKDPIIEYNLTFDENKEILKIITADFDVYIPWLSTYSDIFTTSYIDIQEAFWNENVIARISSTKSWIAENEDFGIKYWPIPETKDEDNIFWDEWPSSHLNCYKNWEHQDIKECYQKRNWISQHFIYIPPEEYKRNYKLRIHNAFLKDYQNWFAVAANVELRYPPPVDPCIEDPWLPQCSCGGDVCKPNKEFCDLQPETSCCTPPWPPTCSVDPCIEDPWLSQCSCGTNECYPNQEYCTKHPEDLCCSTPPSCRSETIFWETSVDIDFDWYYDDHKSTTYEWRIHTYKVRVCNDSDTEFKAYIKLSLPNNTTLIPGSIMNNFDPFMLTNPDPNAIRSDSSFWSEYYQGFVWAHSCSYNSYQVKVDDIVPLGTKIKVINEYRLNWWSLVPTNEVYNIVGGIDMGLDLSSSPGNWSSVVKWEEINYMVKFTHNSPENVSWTITCPRMQNTPDTTCNFWCENTFTFTDLPPYEPVEFIYNATINETVTDFFPITEQCIATAGWKSYNSDIVTIMAVDEPPPPNDPVWNWGYLFIVETRPKLLNSPYEDNRIRPDWRDRAPITYKFQKWPENNFSNYMYPILSNPWSYYMWRPRCWPRSYSYKPWAYTYVVNADSTHSRSSPSYRSKHIYFNLLSTLPEWEPDTQVYPQIFPWDNNSINKTFTINRNQTNMSNWFRYWDSSFRFFPQVTHRALKNWADWNISSTLSWSFPVQKFVYTAYRTETCWYGCWRHSCRRRYNLYEWQHRSTTQHSYSITRDTPIHVIWSTAWFRSRNGDVHTNNTFDLEGESSANTYDLWNWIDDVKSAPRLYTPDSTMWFHSEYMISMSQGAVNDINNTKNLESGKDWYAIRNIKLWHWYVYDRVKNPRKYYDDLIDKQKFWEVRRQSGGTIGDMVLEEDVVYYYPWDLIINNPSWTVDFSWKKATIVVEWDLLVNSNMAYTIDSKRLKDHVYLWLIVKWSVQISPSVTKTVWAWFIDQTLYTWGSKFQLQHFWQLAAWNIVFERKAPEAYEWEENAPSEEIIFDDSIYITTPPWFQELDDGRWSVTTNVNQKTGEIYNIWE